MEMRKRRWLESVGIYERRRKKPCRGRGKGGMEELLEEELKETRGTEQEMERSKRRWLESVDEAEKEAVQRRTWRRRHGKAGGGMGGDRGTKQEMESSKRGWLESVCT